MNAKFIIAALLIAVLCFATFGMATVNKNDPKRYIRDIKPIPKKAVKVPVKRVIATKNVPKKVVRKSLVPKVVRKSNVPKKVVKSSVPKKAVNPNLNKH